MTDGANTKTWLNPLGKGCSQTELSRFPWVLVFSPFPFLPWLRGKSSWPARRKGRGSRRKFPPTQVTREGLSAHLGE